MRFVLNDSIQRGASFSRGIRYSRLLCRSTSDVTIALGTATFDVATGLPVTVGQRVRAFLSQGPQGDPTQFVEGPVTSYSGTTLVINADTISGVANANYSMWQLSVAVDLTGGEFEAVMHFSKKTCSGRDRSTVNMRVAVSTPTTGVFTLYLSPAQTAQLTLGIYNYYVNFTPASSSDKLEVVSGMLLVEDQ